MTELQAPYLTTTPPPILDTSALDRADLQPSTREKYRRAITAMHAAGVNPANHEALQQYADTLPHSGKAFLKSALRIMLAGIERDIKANATPTNLNECQAALLRLDAMKNAVTVRQPKGTKAHIWLSKQQVYLLTSLCPDTLEGERDRVVLGLLLGAGLRREELCNLTFEDVKQQPRRDGSMRTVLEVTGKGGKVRTIPISDKLAKYLTRWREVVGGGRIARALTRGGQVTESMSSVAVFELVQRYGKRIGKPELAPHDLRRTFAHLAHEAGVPLPQISTLLGHENVATTQRYLNLAVDLEASASDFIPIA